MAGYSRGIKATTLPTFKKGMGSVSAYLGLAQSVALQLASFLNQGRPSDPDRAAILLALPNFSLQDSTNKKLIEYWDSIMQNPMALVGATYSAEETQAIMNGAKAIIAQDPKGAMAVGPNVRSQMNAGLEQQAGGPVESAASGMVIQLPSGRQFKLRGRK